MIRFIKSNGYIYLVTFLMLGLALALLIPEALILRPFALERFLFRL